MDGFTGGCKSNSQPEPSPKLTPPEIRQLMVLDGFDLRGYQNPLASIHAVLLRLRKKHPENSGSPILGVLYRHCPLVFSMNAD